MHSTNATERKLTVNTTTAEVTERYLVSMAAAYVSLTAYWTGKRMVASYQTVSYIGEQAAHCATLAAHYASELSRHQKAFAPQVVSELVF